MSRAVAPEWGHKPVDAQEQAEFEVLRALDDALGEDWELHWRAWVNGRQIPIMAVHPLKGVVVWEVCAWRPGEVTVEVREVEDPPTGKPWKTRDFLPPASGGARRNPVDQVLMYRTWIEDVTLSARRDKSVPHVRAALVTPYLEAREATALLGHRSELGEKIQRALPDWLFADYARALRGWDPPDPPFRGHDEDLRAAHAAFARLRRWMGLDPVLSAPIALDAEQERWAKPVKRADHALLHGVVGSGKSLLLAERALRHVRAGQRVLWLAYNITHMHHQHDLLLRQRRLDDVGLAQRVTLTNFHAWMRALYVPRDSPRWHQQHSQEWPAVFAPEELRALLLRQAPGPDEETEVILIDEAQDMRQPWITLLQMVLRPKGQMLAVLDPAQALYDQVISENDWNELGFRIGKLVVSHRLHAHLHSLVNAFAQQFMKNLLPYLAQQLSLMSSGTLRVYWHRHTDQRDASTRALILRALAEMDALAGGEIPHAERAVLVTRKFTGINLIKNAKEELAPLRHVFGESELDRHGEVLARNRFADDPEALVVSTVHSFKGYESRGVVLALHNKATPQELYVGLTRVSAKRLAGVLVVLCPNAEWSEAVAPYVHFWP